MTTPINDARPCTMEAYVAALRSEGLSQGLVNASIAHWLKGDFEAALRPLPDHAQLRLTGQIIMRFRAVSRITGDVIDEGTGDRAAFQSFMSRWAEDVNVSVEVRRNLEPYVPASWEGGAS